MRFKWGVTWTHGTKPNDLIHFMWGSRVNRLPKNITSKNREGKWGSKKQYGIQGSLTSHHVKMRTAILNSPLVRRVSRVFPVKPSTGRCRQEGPSPGRCAPRRAAPRRAAAAAAAAAASLPKSSAPAKRSWSPRAAFWPIYVCRVKKQRSRCFTPIGNTAQQEHASISSSPPSKPNKVYF